MTICGRRARAPPTVCPRFEASEARKTVHKINKQLRKEAAREARKEEHLKRAGMKFLGGCRAQSAAFALRVSNKLRNA